MKNLKIAIEEFAKKDGVDLLGFADKSRFDGVDAQHNPFSIFPEAKTVIMMGKRICRGSLRGIEEGTNFGDYQLFGKNWLEDEFIALSAYNLTNFIESFGWEAVPVPNLYMGNVLDLQTTQRPWCKERRKNRRLKLFIK